MVDFLGAKNYILAELEAKLPHNLSYHGLWHTKDVFRAATDFVKHYQLVGDDAIILETAALYHDCGFLRVYRNHEDEGCKIASEVLPQFGYSEELINSVNQLIMATKIPQTPLNFLSELICDSDLDYIGGDNYDRIATLLFEEFKEYHIVTTELQWFEMQAGFLSSHNFFSTYSKEFRDPGKLLNLEKVRKTLENLRSDEK